VSGEVKERFVEDEIEKVGYLFLDNIVAQVDNVIGIVD